VGWILRAVWGIKFLTKLMIKIVPVKNQNPNLAYSCKIIDIKKTE